MSNFAPPSLVRRSEAPMYVVENLRDAAGPGSRDTIGGRRYGETPMVRGHPSLFWRIMLHRDPTGPADAEEPHLLGCELVLRPEYETVTMWLDETRARYATDDEMFAAEGVGRNQFKVGGLPCWLQDPVARQCACGAEMVFLCGLPEDIGFPTSGGLAGAAALPGVSSPRT